MLQFVLGLGRGPGNGFPFFFFVLTNTFVLHVNGNCDVHRIRTTAVRDVMMMYCIRNGTCAAIAIGIVTVISDITHHLLGLHMHM